jgi:hypothetical protein
MGHPVGPHYLPEQFVHMSQNMPATLAGPYSDELRIQACALFVVISEDSPSCKCVAKAMSKRIWHALLA